MRRQTVVIVDDDEAVLELIGNCLRSEHLETIKASGGVDALRLVQEHTPSLMILDIMLPDISGFEVLRRLRRWSQVPVIMLSGRGQPSDKVKCLDMGADDYMTKPFAVEELAARVRAVLRRQATIALPQMMPPFICPGLRMDFVKRKVTLRGQPVMLTHTEYDLLKELILNSGRVLSYRYLLLGKIWGPEYGEEKQYLHTFINRLRKKIDGGSSEYQYIQAIRGIGYRFQATVSNKSRSISDSD